MSSEILYDQQVSAPWQFSKAPKLRNISRRAQPPAMITCEAVAAALPSKFSGNSA